MKRNKVFISLLMLPLLLSCGDKASASNTGEWFTVSSTSTFIKASNGMYISPFNTVMILKYFKNSKYKFDENFNKDLSSFFLDKVCEYHKEFDRHYYYLDDNNEKITNVRIINESYGTGEEIKCTDELYDLLKIGYDMTLTTNGYFNFYIGNLTSFWDDILTEVCDTWDYESVDPYYNEANKQLMIDYSKSVPSMQDVKSIMTFNDENKSVIFNSIEDIEVDGKLYERSKKDSPFRPYLTPGGIAKGFATDKLKQDLLAKDYKEGYINSGSSSITSLSDLTFTEKGYQTMKVVDPRNGDDYIREVAISIDLYKDYSLSTSGNYSTGKSYPIYDGNGNKIIRHHIINPFTGESSNYHDSVSIISNTLTNGELDALSTAFVNLTLEQGLEFRKTFLESHPDKDLSFIFMDVDEKELNLHISNDLKDAVKVLAQGVNTFYE